MEATALSLKEKIAGIRAQFPILQRSVKGKQLVYFDNAASSQKPQVVIDAVSHYYIESNSNVHRGVHSLSEEATESYEGSRDYIQRFFNAEDRGEIIFTKGTTEGINLVAYSFCDAFLKEGDEILISQMEHHANIVPWQLAAQRKAAAVKVIPIDDRGELILEEAERLLSERTRLLAVAYASNTLGTRNPVEHLISMAHGLDIPVLLDGAQAVPHDSIDVQKLDCDFLAFSGHKVFAPMGSGVLYAKKKWLDAMPPFLSGGDMINEVTLERSTFNTLPYKFEAGTPNVGAAIGLARALEWAKEVGYETIEEQEKKLLDHATKELSQIDGFRVIGESENKVSVISFTIEGVHHQDLGLLLDSKGVAIRTGHHCTQPVMQRFGLEGTARASFSVYNTLEEVDYMVEATKKAVKILR